MQTRKVDGDSNKDISVSVWIFILYLIHTHTLRSDPSLASKFLVAPAVTATASENGAQLQRSCKEAYPWLLEESTSNIKSSAQMGLYILKYLTTYIYISCVYNTLFKKLAWIPNVVSPSLIGYG